MFAWQLVARVHRLQVSTLRARSIFEPTRVKSEARDSAEVAVAVVEVKLLLFLLLRSLLFLLNAFAANFEVAPFK
jgi:hypothetical protein